MFNSCNATFLFTDKCLIVIQSARHLSNLEWYAYMMFDRDDRFNPVVHARRLFQEFAVDAYLCVERNRLRFIRNKQKEIRADLYKNIVEDLDDDIEIRGKRIILPSTFIGGPRHMDQLYQDAMAIVQKYGNPSLFITITASSAWPEIKEALRFGESPSDRPDIVTRVFHLKLKEFIQELTKEGCLGRTASHLFTVEFQKRGMPHTHIILILQGPPLTTPEQIDNIIRCDIPDPITEPRLHELVVKHMLHGPCNGRECWTGKDKCEKGFPKKFSDHTIPVPGSYPNYKRPENGRTVVKNGQVFNNSHVVAYNPYFLMRYECHLNFEIAASIHSVKYLYKYVMKGHDRAYIEVIKEGNSEEGERVGTKRIYQQDETIRLMNTRYVGPQEGKLYIIYRYS